MPVIKQEDRSLSEELRINRAIWAAERQQVLADLRGIPPLDIGPPENGDIRPNVSHVRRNSGGDVYLWAIAEWEQHEAELAARRTRRTRRERNGGLGSEKRRRAWKRGGGARRARDEKGRFV